MGLLRNAIRGSALPSSGVETPERWVEDWFNGGDRSYGPWITESTALHYGPFFAGINAVSTDVGKLPLPLYERLDRGKRKAVEHPLYWVLHDEPNPRMAPIVFKRTVQGHAMTWGTGYARLIWDDRGWVKEMWPLHPGRIKPDVKVTGPGTFDLTWIYRDAANGINTRLFDDEVLPIGGLGFDGVRGYSIVAMARQSIGLGVAAEQFGANFFHKGARPGGVLKHPKTLSEPAQKRLKTNWDNMHQGLDRSQQVAILEEGLEYDAIGIPPEDAQFLETRQLQVTEATRWTRIPPHKIGDLQHATFTNIEHQGLEYVIDTLGGWLVTWEQTINQRCLVGPERKLLFVQNIVEALLRGDIKSRYEAYSIARQNGFLNADDIAELENRNPLPGRVGETYWMPLNMQPALAPGETASERACPVHPGCNCQGKEHA